MTKLTDLAVPSDAVPGGLMMVTPELGAPSGLSVGSLEDETDDPTTERLAELWQPGSVTSTAAKSTIDPRNAG